MSSSPSTPTSGFFFCHEFPDFFQALFGLAVPFQALDFHQRVIKGVKRQFLIPETSDPLDGFHHGFVPKRGQVFRIDFP